MDRCATVTDGIKEALYGEETGALLGAYGLRLSMPGYWLLLELTETVCNRRESGKTADTEAAVKETAARLGVAEKYLKGQIRYLARKAAQNERAEKKLPFPVRSGRVYAVMAERLADVVLRKE